MGDAEVLRLVYEPHAAKKIARRFGVAVATAKLWLRDGLPAARRDRMTRRLLADIARREAELAEVRRRIEAIGESRPWHGGSPAGARDVPSRASVGR